MRRLAPLVLLLAAAAGLAWWLARGDAPAEGALERGAAQHAEPVDATGTGLERTAPEAGRAASARPEPTGASAAEPAGAPRLHVRGEVLDERDAPVADARLELALVRGPTADLLGGATSDARGAFAIDGPPLADFVRRRALRGMLRLAAWGPGLRPTIESGMEPDASGLVRVRLRLHAGASLRGLVVDARGRPAVGAQVSLLEPHSSPAGAGWRVRARVPSGAGGRFVLALPEAGGPFSVHARAEGLGSARRDGVAREDAELGALALTGGGALVGSVRHSDGSPARGFELAATRLPDAAEVDDAERALLGPDEVGGDAGIERAETRTDAAGRFELAGLRPGDYELAAVEPGARLDGLAPRYATGGGSIELVVLGRRLHVRTVDERGAPLVGALVRVHVLGEDPGAAGPERTRVTDGEEARAVFELPADATRLGLSATLGARGPVEALVELAAGVRELERELVLPARTEPGELAVRLASGVGPPPLADVELRSALTGLRQRGFYAVEGAGRSQPLAPGSYLVGARARAWKDGAGDWLPVERAEPVEVRAGETTTVRLELPLGGRVEVRLVPPADGPALGEPPGLGRRESWRLHQELLASHGATVRLRRAEAAAEEQGAPLALLVVAEAWEEERSRLVPGLESGTSGPLPAGAYVLHVAGPAWLPAEARFLLAAGRLTTVEVPLAARASAR